MRKHYQTYRHFIYYLIISGLVYLDQISKNFFVEQKEIAITDWFNMKLSLNPGSAFSLDIPLSITVTLGLTLAIIFLIAPRFKKFNKYRSREQVALAILTAGIIGNTIDRLFYGSVIDFIQVGWWPIFNFADIYLTIAVFYLVIHELILDSTKLQLS